MGPLTAINNYLDMLGKDAELKANPPIVANSDGTYTYYDANTDSITTSRVFSGRQTVPPRHRPVEDQQTRLLMISHRLNVAHGEQPFDHILTIKTANKVLVLIVQNEQATILEDEVGMFPSDGLIAKLRLLSK